MNLKINQLLSHLFLSLDLDTDLEPDGARDGAPVAPLLQVVPHVHLTGQRPHLINAPSINQALFFASKDRKYEKEYVDNLKIKTENDLITNKNTTKPEQ
jgi:hypothetical protein